MSGFCPVALLHKNGGQSWRKSTVMTRNLYGKFGATRSKISNINSHYYLDNACLEIRKIDEFLKAPFVENYWDCTLNFRS